MDQRNVVALSKGGSEAQKPVEDQRNAFLGAFLAKRISSRAGQSRTTATSSLRVGEVAIKAHPQNSNLKPDAAEPAFSTPHRHEMCRAPRHICPAASDP